MRYYVLPAVVAVLIWILPLLGIGAWAFATSGGGPPAVGAAAVFFLCVIGSPLPFAWLIYLRRRWNQRSDVQKRTLFGIPMVLGVVPGFCLLVLFMFLAISSEHPTIWAAIGVLIYISALTAGLSFLGYVGAGVWYRLAYA